MTDKALTTTQSATNGVTTTKKVFDLGNLSPEQKQYLKTQIISGDNVSDADLGYFLDFCQFHALNPFMRQIYGIMRKGKLTTQIGIDGLLSIAHRTNRIASIPAQRWCGEDGIWKEIWVSKTPPVAAKAMVYTKGSNLPFEAVAHWAEYAPIYNGRLGEMWAKMPATMLAKCALTLALRRAFPEQLQGLLTTEEMAQAGNNTAQFTGTIEPQPTVPQPEPTPIPAADINGILAEITKKETVENLGNYYKNLPIEIQAHPEIKARTKIKKLELETIEAAKRTMPKKQTNNPEQQADEPLPSQDEFVMDDEYKFCENELFTDLKKAKTEADWEDVLQRHYDNAPFLKNEGTSKKVNELKHKTKLK